MDIIYSVKELLSTFLPIGEMLQLDRIRFNNGTIIGEKNLTERDWIFPLHFPGDPIFPGSLLIEGAGQVIAMWGWHAGLRGKPRLVKVSAEFESPVSAKDKLVSYIGKIARRQNICIGTVEIRVGERTIGKVSGSVVVLKE